eukprot:jgi/Psemu1/255775/estExt_Genewise1Plus.C_1540020
MLVDVDDELWPRVLTEDVVNSLKDYVRTILGGYNPVPYHNFKHCYHVTISTNKLVDMIVHNKNNDEEEGLPNTFGFRDDPLMQFTLLFSALIHDVDHRGIPNRQLAMEDEDLAIKYNDQSIAENESLFIGFSELLRPKYDALRGVLFPEREDYRRFRRACINLVLTTDIASPERTQLGTSKWKEAFGDPYETTYAGDKRLSASGEEDPAPRTRTARVPPPEKIDELREAVIMETILKSADVGHNLQGFEQMARWSDCLYMELRKAFVDHRGEDPVDGWFHNQIGFLDFYLLPLARKLDDTGAFGDTRGGVFAAIVASNRKRWIEEGMGVTTNIVERGVRYYPNY